MSTTQHTRANSTDTAQTQSYSKHTHIHTQAYSKHIYILKAHTHTHTMAIAASRRSNMPQRGPRSARDLTMRDAPTGPASARRPAANSASNNRSRNSPAGSLAQLKITGWIHPDFTHANDEDRGAHKLHMFVEKRANIAQDKNAKSKGIKKTTKVRARKVRYRLILFFHVCHQTASQAAAQYSTTLEFRFEPPIRDRCR